MTGSPVYNPAVVEWTGPHGLPKFEEVADGDFAPAFEAALAEHDTEIDLVADNAEAPSFENTIVELELAGDNLSRVSALFWNRAGARSRRRCHATIRRSA